MDGFGVSMQHVDWYTLLLDGTDNEIMVEASAIKYEIMYGSIALSYLRPLSSWV